MRMSSFRLSSSVSDRAASSALWIVAESWPDSKTTTIPCALGGESAVHRLELARRRRSGFRESRHIHAAVPEFSDIQLLSVDELVLTETNAQGDDLNAHFVGDLGGKVAGAVGDDAYVAHGTFSLVSVDRLWLGRHVRTPPRPPVREPPGEQNKKQSKGECLREPSQCIDP